MMAQSDDDEVRTVALDRWAWARVTVVIGVALAIVSIMVYLLSDGGQDLFQRRVIIRTFLPDGTGVLRKAGVELNGIRVGRIRSVRISGSNQAGRQVIVDMAIEERYLNAIPVDSHTEVTADNLLGDKYINIRKGRGSETVKADAELEAQPPAATFDPSDLVASLEAVLTSATATLDQIENPSTTVGQLVQTDTFYQQIRNSIAGVQAALHSYSNPKSPFGQALFGHDLYDQLRAPVLDLDKTLTGMQSGEGAIGHALVSSEQYDQLRDAIAGYGKSIAAFRQKDFMTRDEAYVSLQGSLRNVAAVIDAMASGPLFSQTQLYESLNGSSRSAAQFLSEFRKNPEKFLRLKVF